MLRIDVLRLTTLEDADISCTESAGSAVCVEGV